MHKLNGKNKIWKIRNDLKRFEKNKKKKNKRKFEKFLKNKTKNKSYIVPKVFSIIENPGETIRFFNDIINLIKNDFSRGNNKKEYHVIFIDMLEVSKITGDALMYLLSIIRNTRGIEELKIRWVGNYPKKEELKIFLAESGFLHYMRTNSINLKNSTDKYRIQNGTGFECAYSKNIDVRKEICDFTMQKANLEKKNINFLFNILTEIITNIEHAYDENNRSIFFPSWYIMVENEKDKIKYTFIDNGFGIPTTVKKKKIEEFWKFLNMDKEYKYIISALDGSFKRTETRKPERSTGLPDVYEKLKNKKIANLRIISNYAYYNETDPYDLEENIEGTIIYWEVIKEEKNVN